MLKRKLFQEKSVLQKANMGDPVVAQWPRVSTPNEGVPGLISGWGTRYHMPNSKKKKFHVPQDRPSAVKLIIVSKTLVH